MRIAIRTQRTINQWSKETLPFKLDKSAFAKIELTSLKYWKPELLRALKELEKEKSVR
jgi:hypothetical protein